MGGIAFESSDDSIATVDSSGKITGVALGDVSITITGTRTNCYKKLVVNVNSRYTVSYDLVGGNINNNTSINQVLYETAKKYSYTSNIDITGNKLDNYGNS